MPSFHKTQFPKKVRLSGPDCFHLVLDKHAKKHEAGGNVMRQVFYFSHTLEPVAVTNILRSSPLIYWLCNIRLVSGSLFTIPYWAFTNAGNEIIVSLHQHGLEKELPEDILKRDIPIEATRFIEADIIFYPSGSSALVLSWNHVLLDGKGTSLLFDHLNAIAEGKPIQNDHFFPAREKLPNIIRYIRNMYEVKRFIKNSSRPPICSVAPPKAENNSGIRFRRIQFTAGETSQINTNAAKNGSRFGTNLFQIACCLHTVHAINQRRGKAGTLWLPVPYDGRVRGTNCPIISNHVSYLFYRIEPTQLGSLAQTVDSIGAQMKEQIRQGMAKKYDMLLRMMRHIPLWLYYFLISRPGDGAIASFLYSTTGENFSKLTHFMGQPVSDVSIIPAATFPPGLTFIFLKHACALNINIAYSPDVVSEGELALVEQCLKNWLAGDGGENAG